MKNHKKLDSSHKIFHQCVGYLVSFLDHFALLLEEISLWRKQCIYAASDQSWNFLPFSGDFSQATSMLQWFRRKNDLWVSKKNDNRISDIADDRRFLLCWKARRHRLMFCGMWSVATSCRPLITNFSLSASTRGTLSRNFLKKNLEKKRKGTSLCPVLPCSETSRNFPKQRRTPWMFNSGKAHTVCNALCVRIYEIILWYSEHCLLSLSLTYLSKIKTCFICYLKLVFWNLFYILHYHPYFFSDKLILLLSTNFH